MALTLAQLKRDAKNGFISGEIVSYFGGKEIPEMLRGIRKIVDSNSMGIKFRNTNGEISTLYVKCASLIEYTGDSLTTYSAGIREMTQEERDIMNAWNKIAETKEFIERQEWDAVSDGSSTYYQKKAFFHNSKCPYLFGTTEICGKKRDYATNMIIDNSIKGEIKIQYKIYREE